MKIDVSSEKQSQMALYIDKLKIQTLSKSLRKKTRAKTNYCSQVFIVLFK